VGEGKPGRQEWVLNKMGYGRFGSQECARLQLRWSLAVLQSGLDTTRPGSVSRQVGLICQCVATTGDVSSFVMAWALAGVKQDDDVGGSVRIIAGRRQRVAPARQLHRNTKGFAHRCIVCHLLRVCKGNGRATEDARIE
jgi:hypothetical protein